MTRVAAIYWPTSSVGGINTELRALHDEAQRRGDVFHVLRSGKHNGIRPGLFGERKLIRGGDTFVTVDGEAPHGPKVINDTLAFLEGYDRVYFAFLCPHPTKDYGDQPLFLPLYQDFIGPITSRVTDGYWESYADWGKVCIKHSDAVTVSQAAFASYFSHPRVRASRFPFSPRPTTAKREKEPLTVWTSQWKAIKGIHKLLPHLPRVKTKLEMYSNGILYYQMRTTPDWKAAIRKDHFKGFDGNGRADFFGYIPLEDIPNVLARSWFMIDLMGIGRPKNKVYTEGSFNNTTIEALYYGSLPILHRQADKIKGLGDFCAFVDDASEVPEITNSKEWQAFAIDRPRVEGARAWVMKHFSAARIYDEAVMGDF